jgi:uncharacterized protein (DUF3084 family)
MREMQM